MNKNYPEHDTDCCNKCKFYKMIDSGYGWCTAEPPKQKLKIIKMFLFFKKIITIYEYPIVPWNLFKCGKSFIIRGAKQ